MYGSDGLLVLNAIPHLVSLKGFLCATRRKKSANQGRDREASETDTETANV
jgi:hypothetical protein